MNGEITKQELEEIFQDIFDDINLSIEESTSADDIDEWDSLNHINLIGAIERHFKIRFALGELQDLKNVGDMISKILSKKSSKESG